jgi:hypothetical protein
MLLTTFCPLYYRLIEVLEAKMYQSPYLIEILEEERRREKYAEAQQWRMFQDSLNKSMRKPGLIQRALPELAQILGSAWQTMRRFVTARSARPVRREECETC